MIDFTKSEQYTFSIRLSTEGFCFSFFNPLQDSRALLMEKDVDTSLSLTANLEKIFREENFAAYAYRKVNVMTCGRRYTTVPLEFFDDEQAEQLFYYNHTRIGNESVRYNILKKSRIVVLYGMDRSAETFLTKSFPQAKFYAQAAPLAEYFMAKSHAGNCRKLYANLHRNSLDLFACEGGSLLLANTVESRQTADRLYHLLYAWKQLGLDQQADELHISGRPEDRDLLLAELKKYISKVFIMTPPENIDIQALLVCE